jgi:putative transposase
VKPGAGALPDTAGSRSLPGHCRSASSNEFQIFRPQAPCRSVDRERYSIARLQFCAVRHVHGVYVNVRRGCIVAVNSGEAKFGKIVTDHYRKRAASLNTVHLRASVGYRPPAPEVFVPAFSAWPAALRRPAPPATLALPPALN